uniref:uncharacterized protein LOC122772412 n=1 Tax=Solea senegalensis TaxID=28829 RepID=UPI001CD8E826|nr:uncharacterized protein LOC122772412 [Solea senegalensis]
MSRRLRLHFASRRSNTDPLSDAAQRPAESLAHSSVHLKVTPLSPDYANLQRYSSVFIPRINTGGSNKKNVVQISLQPCGRLSGQAHGSVEDGDQGAAGAGSDGGSCSSSMASDAGYCSSNSIFEPEAPEKHRTRSRSTVPLRRCSSLVIFPKSPSSTPPASPVSPVAALPPARATQPPSLHTCASEFSQDDEEVTRKGSTAAAAAVAAAVGGRRRLSKGSASDFRDKHMVHFNIPVQDKPTYRMEDRRTVTDPSPILDRSNRHSSCLLLHFAHQRPTICAEGATTTASVNVEYPEAHKKLYRSTSACLFSTKAADTTHAGRSCVKGQETAEEKRGHRAIQRSFSLEVPYANTGISCHVSNPALCSPYSPHVHIHLSPHCPVSNLPNCVFDHDATKTSKSPEEKVSVCVCARVCVCVCVCVCQQQNNPPQLQEQMSGHENVVQLVQVDSEL